MTKVRWYDLHIKLTEGLKKLYIDFEKKKDTKYEDFRYVGEVFYLKCMEKEDEFRNLFNWSKNISESSLDPFHIYVSFNNNNTTLETKLERLQFYFNVLDIDYKIEENEEDSRYQVPHIPVMQLLTNRPKEKQDEIWNAFIYFIDNDNPELLFNYKEWYGIAFTVVTEFLFWINPFKYISLDKNTQKKLLKHNVVDKIPTNYKEYKELVEKINKITLGDDTIMLLVKYAYDNNIDDMNKEKLNQLFNNPTKERKSSFSNMNFSNFQFGKEKDTKFQLIALKVLENKNHNKKIIKNLKNEELYQFNKHYKFDNDEIAFEDTKELNIYNVYNKIGILKNKININTIVGKNGTGKSTLVELAFVVINNLNYYLKNDINNEDFVKDIYAELFFFTNKLYKITIENKEIKIEKYQEYNNMKSEVNPIVYKDRKVVENLDALYFTYHINYSLHSLNERYYGTWLNSLFSSSYDVNDIPILLEPKRKDGNIDINNVNEIIKERILHNIFIQVDKEKIELIKNKNIIKIKFDVNFEMFTKVEPYKISNEEIKCLIFSLENIFNIKLNSDFKIKENVFKKNMNETVNDFIVEKLERIEIKDYLIYYILCELKELVEDKEYINYRDYKDESKLFNDYVNKIKKSNSYNSNKIKRAIYTLKFLDILNYSTCNNNYTISALSNIIHNKILSLNSDITLNELLPPSFFKIDFIFDNNSTYNNLSSGEKQKIFIINSILFNLKNTILEDKYNYVNIVLDEIELYFHPEMQRDFINDLVNAIKNEEEINVGLELNFLFVTHSPFILSDISSSHLLKLNLDDNNKTIVSDNKNEIFASNIYDLLNDDFYMQGFVGKFAEKTINSIINLIDLYRYLNDDKHIEILKSIYKSNEKENLTFYSNLLNSYNEFFQKDINLDNLFNQKEAIKQKIESNKDKLFNIAEIIGEPLIKNKLIDDLKSIFEKPDTILTIVSELKGKSFDEIKTRLSKYSNSMQKDILEKLFGS